MITERGLTGDEFRRYKTYLQHKETNNRIKETLKVIIEFYNNSDLKTQQFIKLNYFENEPRDIVMDVFDMKLSEYNKMCRKLQRALDVELTKRGL